MFKKILLPTDGSRQSAEAARIAADLASHHEGSVQPVVAVEYHYVSADEVGEALTGPLRERIRSRAERALEEACEQVRGAGARCEAGKVLEGIPADVILQEAEDGEYDVIVMGSRGVSLDRGHDRLVGSVTERVLHQAPCPVLVIRAEPRP